MAAGRQLPTVEPGLYRLAELLCDERIWGLPAGNCTVLHQPASADDIVSALRTAAAGAQDALVFYYAGHGLVDPAVRDGELHLALPGAYEPGGTHLAMSYTHVRRELKVSRGSRRVVILDCCWSGLAQPGSREDAAAIEGTAVLTATPATRKALAPPDERYPAFTGTLIDLLASGIPGEPPVLDLGALYRHADDRLARKGRPRPQFFGTGDSARVPLVRNLAYRTPAAEGRPPTRPCGCARCGARDSTRRRTNSSTRRRSPASRSRCAAGPRNYAVSAGTRMRPGSRARISPDPDPR